MNSPRIIQPSPKRKRGRFARSLALPVPVTIAALFVFGLPHLRLGAPLSAWGATGGLSASAIPTTRAGELPVPPGDDPQDATQDPPPAVASPLAGDEPPEDPHPGSGEDDLGGARRGAIIPIRIEINDVTTASLRRRIDEAKVAGAEVIIFEMNTPGGMVSSALDISHLIKNLTDIKTVAWVNTQAHSAGALISVACDEIVMAPSSTMGDVQVIFGSPMGAQAVDEDLQPKVNTPILADFRASATKNGYDHVLCEAFVIPDREVWWIEHKETGQREFVFRRQKIKRVGGETEENDGSFTRKLLSLASPEAKWKLVETYQDVLSGREVEARQPIVPGTQLLEMSASEAHAYGFSEGIASAEGELQTRYDLSALDRLELTWSENVTLWMTSMYVRGFLLIVIFLGVYVEFNTPGVGVPGLVALICLAIFAGAPYLTGLANVWEIALIGIGFLLIALEIFVIPGFGIAGISGIVFVLVGLTATFVPDDPGKFFPLHIPQFVGAMQAIKTGALTVTAALSLSLLGMFMLSRHLPQMAMMNSVFPQNPTAADVAPADHYHGAVRVGDLGRSEGPLRPAGKARFGEVLADVVSEGDFVDPDTPVEIIERRGNLVVVRPLKRA